MGGERLDLPLSPLSICQVRRDENPSGQRHDEHRAAYGIAREDFAFFEAYFSNYIEGKIIANRNEDSYDILGTFPAATTAPWRERKSQPGRQHFRSYAKCRRLQ